MPAAASDVPQQRRADVGLGVLGFAAMLERMGYSGMTALLTIYMVTESGGLGWDQHKAINIYHLFSGAAFITPFIGAILADKVCGQRRAVGLGALLMGGGLLLLTVPEPIALYGALVLVAIGNGLFKPTIYAMVGGLYGRNDPRRDGAFTLFLMFSSVGGVLGTFVCVALGGKLGWAWGFGSASAALGLGLIVLLAAREHLRGELWAQSEFATDVSERARPRSSEEKDHLVILLVLSLAVGCFYLFSGSLPSTREAGLNGKAPGGLGTLVRSGGAPALAFILSPLFARIWTNLGLRGRDLPAPAKLALGMVLTAIGLVLMTATGGKEVEESPVSLMALAGLLLQAIGWLCIGPIALSAVTRLAPARYIALSMALWWLVTSIPDLFSFEIERWVEANGNGGMLALIGATFVPAIILIALSRWFRSRIHV